VNCSCKLVSVLDGKSLYPFCQAIGGALWYGGTLTGKNICLRKQGVNGAVTTHYF